MDDLPHDFRMTVQKAERFLKAQDALDEMKLQLTEERTGGGTPARISLLERCVKDAVADRQVARSVLDVALKIANRTLYPDTPTLVAEQENAA